LDETYDDADSSIASPQALIGDVPLDNVNAPAANDVFPPEPVAVDLPRAVEEIDQDAADVPGAGESDPSEISEEV
jgi:hypothetical protein